MCEVSEKEQKKVSQAGTTTERGEEIFLPLLLPPFFSRNRGLNFTFAWQAEEGKGGEQIFCYASSSFLRCANSFHFFRERVGEGKLAATLYTEIAGLRLATVILPDPTFYKFRAFISSYWGTLCS